MRGDSFAQEWADLIDKLIIFFSKMGLSPSEPSLEEEQQRLAENYSSHPTPTFISSAASQQRWLCQFRGSLSFRECVYTFATLLQQYGQLIKEGQEVAVSDEDCRVTPFGEIVVEAQGALRNRGPQAYRQFINGLFELVSGLSAEGEWAGNQLVRRLRQRVTQLVGQFEDQQQLFNNTLSQFSQFLQLGTKHTNLIGALCRLNDQARRKSGLEDSIRLNRVDASFGTISVFSSSFMDKMGGLSGREERKSKFSELREWNGGGESGVSGGSWKQSLDGNMRFEDSFSCHGVRGRAERGFRKKKSSSSYYISPQYSINMYPGPRGQKGQILKVKRERYRTQTLGSSCLESRELGNRTSMELEEQKMRRVQGETPSCVLASMARFVEVKEVSSSRSYIY